jgi:hypothetical protein
MLCGSEFSGAGGVSVESGTKTRTLLESMFARTALH